MGLLFVLILWFVVLAVVSIILGAIVMLIIRLSCKKENRKRKMWLGFFSPAVAIGTYSISSLITMIIIAAFLDVDIGIGDGWKGNLPNGYYLYSIDMPENGFVCKKSDSISSEVIVDKVSKVSVCGDEVLGYANSKYFALSTNNGDVSYYDTEEDLIRECGIDKLELETNDSFYWQQKKSAYIIGSIICLLITIGVMLLFWRIKGAR